jgi:tetratricopeptide (TPR) repeat protein
MVFKDSCFRNIFFALAILLSSWILRDSFKASITEDERHHIEHGEEILKWFQGKENNAVLSPIDSSGRWTYYSEGISSKSAINIYGGISDFAAAFLHHYLASSSDIYQFKHGFAAFLGALCFILIGLIVFEITGSWVAAIIALLLAFTSPRLFGNSLSNPKDVPFMTACTFSLYMTIRYLKYLPVIKWYDLLGLIIALAIPMAIRVGAFLNFFYLLAGAIVVLAYLVYRKDISLKFFLFLLLKTWLIILLGYFLAILLWPWAQQSPIQNPLFALKVFSDFSIFDAYELFDGRYLRNADKPWYFVLKWVIITLPIATVLGLIISPLFFYSKVKKGQYASLFLLFVVCISFLLPHLVIILKKSNVYNGARHVLFTIPSLIILAAVGFYYLYKFFQRYGREHLFAAFFILIIAEPLLFQIKNSPNQALYFSPLIGGIKEAFGNYEIDYWGYANRPALEWLDDTVGKLGLEKKLRVRMFYGEQSKIAHIISKHTKNLDYVLTHPNTYEWDVSLVMLSEAKHDTTMYQEWPPEGTVYATLVDGVAISALVINKSIYPNAQLDIQTLSSPKSGVKTYENSSRGEFAKGLDLYNQGDFLNSILSFQKSLEMGGDQVLILNNITSAFNNLGMYEDAIKAADIGIKLKSDFGLLNNNRKWAIEQLAKQNKDEKYLLNLSYYYYLLGYHNQSIAVCRDVIKMNPGNAVAYNNICSAYNSMGKWDSAIVACREALRINADFTLAKNNLKWALESKQKN